MLPPRVAAMTSSPMMRDVEPLGHFERIPRVGIAAAIRFLGAELRDAARQLQFRRRVGECRRGAAPCVSMVHGSGLIPVSTNSTGRVGVAVDERVHALDERRS